MKPLFTNSPTPEITAWAKVGEETILAKKFGLALVSQKFVNPAVTEASEEYAFCRKAPGVTVVPVLPNGNLIITKTFKQGSNTLIWEFPAGRKPKGVVADDQARAELSEESGLVPSKMVYLGRVTVAPRKLDTYEDLFVALNCTVGEPKPGPGEILEVYELTPTEFWSLTMNGLVSGFSEIAAGRAATNGYIMKP